MCIPRPVWLTPRRLVTATVLAAVFAAGWYLGQPVLPSRCEVPAAPVRYSDHLAVDTLPDCDTRPRLRSWFSGDFR
ncbi:hypothetical protein [Streptomyces sp. NPDC101393]|uniref:hypothetical protein n=1 Tax=Streptomyces sp. NPDC101393 TaxID=3366141 RepID=UPI0037F147CC